MRCVDATLLVVCLAAAARRCDAAYTPVTAPAGTKNYTAASLGILSSSVVNSNVAALEQSAFAAPVTLRCTFINLAWNNDYFDAYGGLAQPVSAPLAVALSTLQPGSLLPLQPSDVDGFLVRIITSLASSLNFSVVWSMVTPPPELLHPPASSELLMLYAFRAWNQTCSLSQLSTTPARALYFNQTTPIMSYGFQVVTTRPSYPQRSTVDRIFLWTHPFSAGLWCLLMGNILFFSIIMPMLEYRKADNQFGGSTETYKNLLGRALYAASMGPSKPDTFEARTAGGRFAAALNAFGFMIIIASYTATLAAQFTTSAAPVQPIKSVADFSPAMPMCARSSSVLLTLLNATEQNAVASLTPTYTFASSLYGVHASIQAMLDGAGCAGAVASTPDVAWTMNYNDSHGTLCNAIPTGDSFGDQSLPLTFAVGALTSGQMTAMNVAISQMRATSSYLEPLKAHFFPPPPRLVCQSQDDAAAVSLLALAPAQTLEPIDLAGAFILQATGALLGMLMLVTKRARSHVWVVVGRVGSARSSMRSKREGSFQIAQTIPVDRTSSLDFPGASATDYLENSHVI